MKRFLCGLLACAATTISVSGWASSSDREYNLELARSSVREVLAEFSRQTGLQTGFYPDSVAEEGVFVGPLKGHYTAEDALKELFASSGLSFTRDNERTITVVALEAATSSRRGDHAASESGNGDQSKPEFIRLTDRRFADEFMAAQTDQERRPSDGGTTESEDRPIASANSNANAREVESNKRQRGRIEEVIVTATKRAARLQDVPLSIAAVTADDIDQRRLVSAADYLRGMPGVNQVDSAVGQTIVIRGIETSPLFQNFNAGTTVATYFGETPTTNSAGSGGGTNVDLKLVDIERVEVLRGPQGTAFGSSSMGGAVRTIPVAPKLDHFEGKVAAGYSETSGTGGDNYNVQAVGNIPLVKDKIAIRATAYQFQDSGFYRNRAGSDAAFQAAIAPFDARSFATDKAEVGSYYVIGGRVAAQFQASDDLRFTLSYLSQKNETDGFPLATSGTYEQTLLQVAPEHVVRGQKGGLFDSDIDIANAMMEYNLGWANLLATYSYTDSGSTRALPLSYVSIILPVSALGTSDHREHVGEIRLATRFEGAWNFLAGIYAEEIKDDDVVDNLFYGDSGEQSLGAYVDRRNLKQKAAFGEVTWQFLPDLTLTGGVRAYRYDRTYQFDASGPFYGDTHVLEDADASDANFRANLSYKPDDGKLLYADWSQGFRLGRPQAGLPPGICDPDGNGVVDGTNITLESTKRVNSDHIDSYELGGKFALLDHRLMLAADIFRMDWSDVPVNLLPGPLAPQTCGTFSYIANAGEARSTGVEFQANFQVTKPFRVDLGVSWIDAKLTEDVPAQGFTSGDRLPGSPEVNANLGVQYAFEFAGHEAFVRADSIYVGTFYGDVQESPSTKSGDYVKLDASARMEIGNLNIDLFVHNLTNEDAFTFRSIFGFVGEFYGYRLRPRTIGLQLGYTF